MTKEINAIDEKYIKDLAKTDSVQQMAKELLEKMDVDDMSLLISTFILMKLKGAQYNEILYHYIIKRFFHLIKKLFIALPQLIPQMIIDVEFINIMTKIFGKEVDLKDLFQSE